MQTRYPNSELRDRVSGYVLAGGRSSRMGTDKALLDFGGVTLLDRAVATLREVCDEVSVVIGAGRQPYEGFRCLRDIYPDCGAPGGVHAALADCRKEFALILAVDLPYVDADGLSHLFDLIESSPPTDVALPVDDELRAQPLCAIYRIGTCLPVINDLLRTSQPSLRDVIGRIRAARVPRAEICSDVRFLRNVNTPDDLREAIASGQSI